MSLPELIFLLACVLPQSAVDPALPDYKPEAKVSGTLRFNSSASMLNFTSVIVEEFSKRHSEVRSQVERMGTESGAPELVEVRDLIAMMGRDFMPKEIESIERKWGRKPTQVAVMYDMLAVFVHKDNPMESITLEQLDAIYSSTRKRGAKEGIERWGQLGLTGEWADLPIRPQGRNSASGAYGFFKRAILNKGDFKDAINENPGSRSIVEAVAKDKSAIGYSGLGYGTAEVKAIALAWTPDARPVRPLPELVYGGTYPLSRSLDVGLNIHPETGLDPLRREFLRFVFSKQGQEVVEKDGYFPVTAAIAKEQLKKLGIEK